MKFSSVNPATDEVVWDGVAATNADIDRAVKRAQDAFTSFSRLSFEKRAEYMQRFGIELTHNIQKLAECISQEMGKPLWESRQEVTAMKNKIDISIRAYQERCREMHEIMGTSLVATRHKPHGVVAVFGPFNFPGHLPNGHIVPALLAGNTVLFKPSEKTPKVGELTVELWKRAGLPEGVLNLIQGGKDVAEVILSRPEVKGIFFTGSYQAGMAIQQKSASFYDRIVALEMGGNNPLVVSTTSDIKAAAFIIMQSAFITSGQRCSCARRLILIENNQTTELLDELKRITKALAIGPYTDFPEPYMGPLVSKEAAASLLAAQIKLMAHGGKSILELTAKGAFVTPGIMDMTDASYSDLELFGPFLQCFRVKTLEQAIEKANETEYGLTAGIISDSQEEYEQFYQRVKAGVINWNTPLTGASSRAPFGGLKKSGNFRPSAYYAADYTAYPVASQEIKTVSLPEELPPGVTIE